MNLTIFGSTGRTGQYIVKQALERGHQVTAHTRSPDKLDLDDNNLQIVEGDIRKADSVQDAVEGADAVISALGPTKNKPVFAISEGTEHILDAMDSHGVERLIASAGAGVGYPKDDSGLLDRVMSLLLKLFSKWIYEDMKRTVEIIRSSDVRWTVVRAPMLTDDEPKGEVKAGYVGKGVGARITRADMARFMLDQVNSDQFVQDAPAISN
ncbi:MAG: SDR family oxidoreductase [Anaerolineales bacterium]|nr:SDR family oxidoreductase [Anaerolineales bacterium]MBS3753118.1 SDR family oxidoreductase [Anaerolineales bacterium]